MVAAPEGFNEEWYPTSFSDSAMLLIGPLGRWIFRNSGIGVGRSGVRLQGIGAVNYPWDDIEAIVPRKGAGVVGTLLKAHVLVSKAKGRVNFPLHQTADPKALIATLKAKGYLSHLEE